MQTPISQIYITDPASPLPPSLIRRSASVRAAFPDHDYTLYDSETLRSFLEEEFDGEIIAAFDRLKPYAYKADLARYCLLLRKGGWYFDIGTLVRHRMNVKPDVELMVFKEANRHSGTSWAVQNSVIYARPGHPVFEKAIELVLENCRNGYYGLKAICPTGPNLFGEALAATRRKQGLVVGDFMDLTPTHHLKNRAFVLPDGTIFAFSKPHEGGDLVSFGAVGTNDYNRLWKARQVYDPDVQLP